MLGRYGVGKYFAWQLKDRRLQYRLKEELLQQDEALDGCYVKRTDVDAQRLDAQAVVDRYRALAQLERAFRYLKTVVLEIRPIWHWLDERIRAHVFICMFAYCVQRQALRRLAPLFEPDDAGAQRRWSWARVLERLKAIRIQVVRLGKVLLAGVVSSPDAGQQRLLGLLGLKPQP